MTVDDPVAGDGVTQERLGTITRADGSSQVTYNGYPLYYFDMDIKPGDAKGQDSFSVWYVVSTDGGPIRTTASVNIGENETMGSMLVDPAGRSLYLFSFDAPGVSNCAGDCALVWPPLLTVNPPVAGEGVAASLLGTISRDDGSLQVTYDGLPLYYFDMDIKAGDADGQAVGNVWWVISAQNPVLIALGELSDSGQAGWARLSPRGNFTEVALSLPDGNLATELVHIHSGQCGDTLGGVVHGLTNFADGAGSSVTMVEASLASVMTGGFAINSHVSGNPGFYTSCGNIPTLADSVSFPLAELNDEGQTGWATMTARGSQTEVVLSATAGISELNHIHLGSCSDLGGVEFGLTNMAGGTSVTTVDATLASLRTGGFAINLHKTGEPATYTSCGNVPGESVAVALAELNDSGQTGTATLTAANGQTQVVLSATADISELNHIHLGSCDNLGGVEYGLTNMSGGSSVTTVDATLASLQTEGFAVNLHMIGDPSVYTSCGDIPGGSVTVTLSQLNDFGQTGSATLTAVSGKTQVVISATTDISDLNHIHLGSCTNLGGVEHGLTNMAGGASVTTVDASLASLRTGGFRY